MHEASPTMRRGRIADLLRGQPVRSQEELRRALERQGIAVTQATLSRDLRGLGVAKTPAGYALPSTGNGGGAPPASPASAPALAEFERLARLFLVSADFVGHMAVLKTPPGNAHGLGVALDRAAFEGIVGTIAGDDTLFALGRASSDARRLVRLALRAARR